MKHPFFLLISLSLVVNFTFGQQVQYYKDQDSNIHLCGPFPLNILETDSNYRKWYQKSYDDFLLKSTKTEWGRLLADTDVEVFLGTWCGDSQNWVPKFVKLWDQLGLPREHLHFTALYAGIEGASKYKQGPNREESGKNIHRVPTFIFKKNGQEFSRIVESPVNDLVTDLAQIAMGIPSKPNYRGASYMQDLLSKKKIEEIKENEQEHLNMAYRLVKGNPSELNTLGYVLLESGRINEALLVFNFNMRCFRYDPNVYDSYAEALAKNGQTEKAIEMYEKVLLLDRSNSHAATRLDLLRKK